MPLGKTQSTKQKNITSLIIILGVILLINFIAHYYYTRIDLTSDKRYSIADVSKNIMKNLDDIVFIRVYLDGDMPVNMKMFQRSIREKLDELANYSNGNLQYEFFNPSERNEHERSTLKMELQQKGMLNYLIQESDEQGGTTQRIIFPGATVVYQGSEMVINFVQYNERYSDVENLNFAQQNLEYNIVSATEQISRKNKPLIAFVEGHGELNDLQIGGITTELSKYYEVQRVTLNGRIGRLDDCAAVIVAKPTQAWSEDDKIVIDQYVMNGGRVAWFIDAAYIHEDSLSRGDLTLGTMCEHNLNDQLFHYGVRVNTNIIQDLQSGSLLVNLASGAMPADFRPVPWLYYPLLIPPDDNPLTKGLNLIYSQYPGVIDTVGMNNKIKNHFLLYSSEKSRVINVPLMISLREIENRYSPSEFNQSYLPVAASLEGIFTSSFRNRITSQYNHGQNFDFKADSKATKMIIVSDGDIIRNTTAVRGNKLVPHPLGFDRVTGQTYGNKEFVSNIINYLTDESDLLSLRNYDYVLRLLNKTKTAKRTPIILINTVLPIILVLLSAILFTWWRRRKYTS